MVLDISKNLPYIIAEIGHNHQGDLNIAFEMFKEAKHAGASAVKLQKRNNKNYIQKNFLMTNIITKIVMVIHMENTENF